MLSTAILLATLAGFDAQPWLPPPPTRRVDQSQPWDAAKAVTVDPMSRADVALAYQTIYLPQAGVAPGWNGSTAGCVAGSTSTAFQTAVIDRVNFYRALAGVPGTVAATGNATVRANAQAAALMMSAEGDLSHNPGPGWACYSPGGAGTNGGAGSANLALGAYGTAAIDLYMDDFGDGNEPVGHRRWLLYPPQVQMATGDIPTGTRSNALWVFGPTGTRPPTPNGVAWPPRGFVPYQVLPDTSNRWSLSYPNANFSAAVVTMAWNGIPIPVVYDSRTANGYGDNTLVWRPAQGATAVRYGAAGVDRTYQVVVSGIGGSAPSVISYTVTVIDGLEQPVEVERVFADGFES